MEKTINTGGKATKSDGTLSRETVPPTTRTVEAEQELADGSSTPSRADTVAVQDAKRLAYGDASNEIEQQGTGSNSNRSKRPMPADDEVVPTLARPSSRFKAAEGDSDGGEAVVSTTRTMLEHQPTGVAAASSTPSTRQRATAIPKTGASSLFSSSNRSGRRTYANPIDHMRLGRQEAGEGNVVASNVAYSVSGNSISGDTTRGSSDGRGRTTEIGGPSGMIAATTGNNSTLAPSSSSSLRAGFATRPIFDSTMNQNPRNVVVLPRTMASLPHHGMLGLQGQYYAAITATQQASILLPSVTTQQIGPYPSILAAQAAPALSPILSLQPPTAVIPIVLPAIQQQPAVHPYVMTGQPAARLGPVNHPPSGAPEQFCVRAAAPQSTSRQSSPTRHDLFPRTESGGICMYMSSDDDNLSDYQILARKQLEYFEASTDDSTCNIQGRKKQVHVGQVGIRCMHCATKLPYYQQTKCNIYYPTQLKGIYQSAQNIAATHLMDVCPCIPESIKSELRSLRPIKKPGASGKIYWAEAARFVGVYETDEGLRMKKPNG